MKYLILTILAFTSLNLFSQEDNTEGIRIDLTHNTKFKLPDGKIIGIKEYDNLTFNGDYSINTKGLKPGEIPEFYLLRKSTKEEKKETFQMKEISKEKSMTNGEKK